MRVQLLVRGVACALCLAAWATIAQSAFAQAPSTPTRFVTMGCLSRGSSPDQFIITDTRGDRPRQYRLDVADPKQIAWHVGHTIEVHGTLGAGTPAVIKVSNLIYVSTTCAAPKK
jgi:hypothetical protein